MGDKSRAELVLEAVKILLWPVLVIFAIIWFQADVVEILKSRTWKIGIIEVGDRIETLENTVQDELILQKDYLNKIQDNAGDVDMVTAFAGQALNSLENAQSGVRKEIRTIQDAIPERGQPEPVSTQAPSAAIAAEPSSAKGWEHLGFDRLVQKNIEDAIEAFTESEKLWPDYHNVSEIRRLLVDKRESLGDKQSPEWSALYETILEKYSWGLPSGVRRQFQQLQSGS